MSFKCPSCGNQVPAEARFCPKCGTALKSRKKGKSKAEAKPDPKPKSAGIKGYNLLFLVALVSLIVVGIYGYRYITPVNTADPHENSQGAMVQQQAAPMDPTTLNGLKAQLNANPNGAAENIELANYLFDHQRFDEALTYYQKALTIQPNNADVLVDAGVCYFNHQNFQEAKDYFNKALQVNPNHPNALYNLGVASAQTGDMQDMLNAWKKLIEVAPESGPAQTAKQMIDQVKSSMGGN